MKMKFVTIAAEEIDGKIQITTNTKHERRHCPSLSHVEYKITMKDENATGFDGCNVCYGGNDE